jgi:hypothetical protein
MKKVSKSASFVIVIVFFLLIFLGGMWASRQKMKYSSPASEVVKAKAQDHKNATYIIEGEDVLLSDGISTRNILPGTEAKVTTKYFGKDFFYDFNKDGREDVVFILTQEEGGSGVFYYLVGALNLPDGYKGSKAVFLGDRIIPESIEKGTEEDLVLANYLDRAPGESFAKKPSHNRSMWLYFDSKALEFGEIAPDFDLGPY